MLDGNLVSKHSIVVDFIFVWIGKGICVWFDLLCIEHTGRGGLYVTLAP